MNLIYVSNARLPTEKAHGINIMKMCEAFARNGHKVELLVPNRKTFNTDPFDFYSVEKIFSIKRIPTLDTVRFGRVGYMVQTVTFAFWVCLYLFRKSDSYYIYSRDDVVLFILSFFKSQFTFEVHTKGYSFIRKRVIKTSEKVIVITQGLKDYFLQKAVPEKKILVAHDAIDLETFQDIGWDKDSLRKSLHLPLKKKLVLYAGKYTTMGLDKGVGGLIENFPAVVTRYSDAMLVIVGIEKGEMEKVKALVEKAGLSDESILLVKHLPRREALKYIIAADALVMNYPKEDHYSYYMSPLKMFEYMASKNVIVSSDLPSIREVLDEDSALFFSPGNGPALAESIFDALKQSDTVQKKAAHAYQKVLGYTWEARAKEVVSS